MGFLMILILEFSNGWNLDASSCFRSDWWYLTAISLHALRWIVYANRTLRRLMLKASFFSTWDYVLIGKRLVIQWVKTIKTFDESQQMLLLNTNFNFIFSRNVGRRELGSLAVDLPSFNGLAHSTIKFKINQNNKNFEFKSNIMRLFNLKAPS